MSNFINVKDLKKWIHEHELERKTIEGFWENFNNWKKEYPDEYEGTFKDGFTPERLSLYINTASFTITNYPDLITLF